MVSFGVGACVGTMLPWGPDSLRGHLCPLHLPTRSFPNVKGKLHWTLVESCKTDFIGAAAVGERFQYSTELNSEYSRHLGTYS